MLKQLTTSIIIALLFLGLGIFVGTKISKKPIPQGAATNSENTYQAGWDAAREKIKQSPQAAMMQPQGEIKNIGGTIQKISGNKLTVKTFSMDPLAEESMSERIITIDSNTKISLNVQKSPEVMQKEMENFQEKMKAQQSDSANMTEPVMPPMPFETKNITASELKEGQQILITANEDIATKKEFSAIQIDAQEAVTMPEPIVMPEPIAAPVPMPTPMR